MADLPDPKRYGLRNASPEKPVSELASKETRRQVFKQIYLPVGIGVLVLVGMVAGISWTGVGTTGVWADISLVLILIPTFLLGLVGLIILVGLTYALLKLIDLLPSPLHRLHAEIERLGKATRQGADGIVRPIFILGAAKAALKAAGSLIISIFQLD